MSKALAALCLLLTLGCGAPLSSVSGGELFVSVRRGFSAAAGIKVSLQPAGTACPTLNATADANGVPIPALAAGGTRGGNYYFVPTTSCEVPSWLFESGIDPGDIPLGGPLTITLKDGSGSVVLESADALAFELRPVPAASRKGGDPLRFELSRPVRSFELPKLSFRKAGSSDLLPASTYALPTVEGANVVSTVPSQGAGSYTWILTVDARVDATSCTGVATCQPLWVEASAEGSFTVDP